VTNGGGLSIRTCLAGATGWAGSALALAIARWEILDYAHDDKKDAPSGTARELAHRLSAVRPSELTVPLEQTQGLPETRGARP